MLQPETVVLERKSKHFADQHEHQDVEENGEGIILRSATLRQIMQGPAQAGGQEHDEQPEADRETGGAEPPLDAVVAARFRRIGENRCGFRGGHHREKVVTILSRSETVATHALRIFRRSQESLRPARAWPLPHSTAAYVRYRRPEIKPMGRRRSRPSERRGRTSR